MADTLYVAAYFRSMRQLRYYYFPKGIEKEREGQTEREGEREKYTYIHIYHRLGYIRFMIATVRVRDRRYMFYVRIVRAQEKFHFSAAGLRNLRTRRKISRCNFEMELN